MEQERLPSTKRTLVPPDQYFAVIFTSTLSGHDMVTYRRVGERMEELARQHPGCLGFDSCRNATGNGNDDDGNTNDDENRNGRGAGGLGITVSYWKTKEDIQSWRREAEHVVAQQMGQKTWYQNYRIRVAKVERDYSFQR